MAGGPGGPSRPAWASGPSHVLFTDCLRDDQKTPCVTREKQSERPLAAHLFGWDPAGPYFKVVLSSAAVGAARARLARPSHTCGSLLCGESMLIQALYKSVSLFFGFVFLF